MNEYEELTKVAQLLKRVPVTGDYWMVMQACVNSVNKVAESLKGEENAINNDNKPESSIS